MAYDHGTLTQELFDLIVGVPEFKLVSGVTLGGNEPDPTLIRLDPPACWVMFVGDQQRDNAEGSVPTQQAMIFMFNAFVYLPGAQQNELIEKWLPLLKLCITGVHGQESEANTGHRWEYKGQKLALANTNRLVYAQRYTISGFI